jgi:hypothetical protein
MTRDEAVAQIKQVLGFRSDLTTQAEDGLKFQQNELEHEAQLPRFLLEETLSLTCTADTERMTPPTGFLREWDEDGLYVQEPDSDPVKWIKLEKDEPSYLRSVYGETEASIPEAYAFDGTSFMLFPTPDAAYTFRMIYYKADTVLSSNVTNKWLTNLPYLLIGRAGAVLAASARDQAALGIFGSMVAENTAKLNSWSTDRDMAGKKLVVGGPD